MKYYSKNRLQKLVAMLLVFSGGLALGMAWFFQHALNMAPCSLCLLERWPYRILIGIGLVGLFIPIRYVTTVLWMAVCVLLVGLGLSVLHIGVEQAWWHSPLPECNATLVHTDSLVDRLNAMPDRPNRPCDAPSYLFSWLPVSLTMLNGGYVLGLILILIRWLVKGRRENGYGSR